MKLLNNDGSYNYSKFAGDKGTWMITGSRSQTNHTNPFLCIDSFRNDKGETMEVKREIVFEQMSNGKIRPVEESLIKAVNIPKKEWDKYITKSNREQE